MSVRRSGGGGTRRAFTGRGAPGSSWPAALLSGLAAAALGFAFCSFSEAPASGLLFRPAIRGLTVPPVAARGVGSGLRFTNPFLEPGQDETYPAGGDAARDPDGFDLGDACIGGPVTRFIGAAGGFKPYRFKSSNLGSRLAIFTDSSDPVSTDLTLSAAGLLSGFIGSATIVGTSATAFTPFRFGVVLEDAVGTAFGSSRSGTFRLAVFRSDAALFRHAQDRLPTAFLGLDYLAQLDVLGGTAPVTYTVVEGSVRLNGAARPKLKGLETFGLTLTSSGLLYGRPLVGGYLGFTVRAEDAAGRLAKDRSNTTTDQQLTLKVEFGGAANSDLLSSYCKLNLVADTDKPGRDKFSCRALFDLKDERKDNLAAGTFKLRLGRNEYEGDFDDRGNVRTTLNGGEKLRVRVSDKGLLTVKLTGATLSDALGADGTDTAPSPLVWSVTVGSTTTCEVLPLKGRTRGTRRRLYYKLGRTGTPLAGAFQVFMVRGAERKNFRLDEATRWLVRFVGVPGTPYGGTAPTIGAEAATVKLGANFSQSFTLAALNRRVEFKATHDAAGLFRLLLDPAKFVHRLETNYLTPGELGVPQAIGEREAALLPFGLELGAGGATFFGETGRVIFPRRGRWEDRP